MSERNSLPSTSESSRSRSRMLVRVLMLDDSVLTFTMPQKCLGRDLYSQVCRHLQLIETDYFGLEFDDYQNIKCWLDYEKPLAKQLNDAADLMRFCVKFYTPDPGLLEDDFTRYLYALQTKRDMANGHLTCTENTAAVMASYIAQAELGDFLEGEGQYSDSSYLSSLRFIPNQSTEFLNKVMMQHRLHIGLSPSVADFNLLDIARKLDMYGIRMHSAKDHEGVALNLAVANVGILVFQNNTRINTFSWAKIRKLSFKRKKFLIKLHPEGYGYYKDTVEFYFLSRNECKNFWKKCIEYHAFFRCADVKNGPASTNGGSHRKKSRMMSRGSSFRYSGRTQKQLLDYVKENYVKRTTPFDRTISSSRVSSLRGGGGDGGDETGDGSSAMIVNTNNQSMSAPQSAVASRAGTAARDGLPPFQDQDGLASGGLSLRLTPGVIGDHETSPNRSVYPISSRSGGAGGGAIGGSAGGSRGGLAHDDDSSTQSTGSHFLTGTGAGATSSNPGINSHNSLSRQQHQSVSSPGTAADNVPQSQSRSSLKSGAPPSPNPHTAQAQPQPPSIDALHIHHDRHGAGGRGGGPIQSNDYGASLHTQNEQGDQPLTSPPGAGQPPEYSRLMQQPQQDQFLRKASAPYGMNEKQYQNRMTEQHIMREPHQSSPMRRIQSEQTYDSMGGASQRIGGGGGGANRPNRFTEIPEEEHNDDRSPVLTPNDISRKPLTVPSSDEFFLGSSTSMGSTSAGEHQINQQHYLHSATPATATPASTNLRSSSSPPPPHYHPSGPSSSTTTVVVGKTAEILSSSSPPPHSMAGGPATVSGGAGGGGGVSNTTGSGTVVVNGHVTAGAGVGATTEISSGPKQVTPVVSSGSTSLQKNDNIFFIIKELLMTERTYRKDLEVLNIHFRNAIDHDGVAPESLTQLLFALLDPIYDFHCAFLRDIEQRLGSWENKSVPTVISGDYRKIGDIMLNLTAMVQSYQNFIGQHGKILGEMQQSFKHDKQFELVYKDFEAEKVCYLPLVTFLLKPAQRLWHYRLILEKLTSYIDRDHIDYADCRVALDRLRITTDSTHETLQRIANVQKLIEIERDLIGVENLLQPAREFVREGCLQKLSKRGYQQRMFFLFTDTLLYTSRSAVPSLQFKVHGQLALKSVIIEETDPKMAVENSFTIYGGNRCIVVAASCLEERDKWMEDLQAVVTQAKVAASGGPGSAAAAGVESERVRYNSLKHYTSSSENIDSDAAGKGPGGGAGGPGGRKIEHRANTTMHVCWHRNSSVSMADYLISLRNQLSGYLLRKFKNSNGWQKLWVVFTNFCLFFYKTYRDDFPLASLPLLGYAILRPTEVDKVDKDHVFKLQFKNHVYFFRAESQYTFDRWMEVLGSATSSVQRTRIFSRMDSASTSTGPPPPPPSAISATGSTPLDSIR